MDLLCFERFLCPYSVGCFLLAAGFLFGGWTFYVLIGFCVLILLAAGFIGFWVAVRL